ATGGDARLHSSGAYARVSDPWIDRRRSSSADGRAAVTVLVLVTGLQGTGKSTIAARCADLLDHSTGEGVSDGRDRLASVAHRFLVTVGERRRQVAVPFRREAGEEHVRAFALDPVFDSAA